MVWPAKKVIKEYLQADVFCPWCGSDEVKTHLPETEVSIAWQSHYCEKCNKEWQNEYTLTGISTLADGGDRIHYEGN